MKTLIRKLSVATLMAASFVAVPHASAQLVVAINQTSGDTLPGQGGTTDPDYTFFGAFRPGGGNGPQTLTDFTQTTHGFNGSDMPTINAPVGSFNGAFPITTVTAASVITGEQFFSLSPVDLVDFTVSSTAASAYSLSAFFGIANNGGGEYINGSFTVTLDDSMGNQLSSATLAVTDNNSSSTTGLFANFTLSGLATGDVIHLIGTPAQSSTNVQLPYVGGVGFSPVAAPEPSTYAMLALGFGALMLLIRARRTA